MNTPSYPPTEHERIRDRAHAILQDAGERPLDASSDRWAAACHQARHEHPCDHCGQTVRPTRADECDDRNRDSLQGSWVHLDGFYACSKADRRAGDDASVAGTETLAAWEALAAHYAGPELTDAEHHALTEELGS